MAYLKKSLYLGLERPREYLKEGVVHYPVIEILPLTSPFLPPCTHTLFTSKTTVALFFQKPYLQEDKIAIAVGTKTQKALEEKGWHALTPCLETQEGIIALIETLDLRGAHFFFPHSALARPCIINYFKEKEIAYTELILYTAVINRKLPLLDLTLYSEAIFTSPSTVEAFFTLYPKIPQTLHCTAIGPITKKSLTNQVKISLLGR